MAEEPQSFDAVKGRLEEIVDEVNAEGVSLDDALALYEEAVKLGLSACEVSESDLFPEPEAEPALDAAEASADSTDPMGMGISGSAEAPGDAVQAQTAALEDKYRDSNIAEAQLIEYVDDRASVQPPEDESDGTPENPR